MVDAIYIWDFAVLRHQEKALAPLCIAVRPVNTHATWWQDTESLTRRYVGYIADQSPTVDESSLIPGPTIT